MALDAAGDTVASNDPLLQLRFSPDGRYVIAQDRREVTVLTAEPFAILFRIPAELAHLAQFTPDSQQVVFVVSGGIKSGAHVERWSVTDQTLIQSAALPVLVCGTGELSPDGEVFVCLDFKSTLHIVDVASGQTMFLKKEFTWLFRDDYRNDIYGYPLKSGELGSANIEFSPDSRFVLVRPKNADGKILLWNVAERSPVKLTGPLKQIKNGSTYAFMSPDRILVWNGSNKVDRARGLAHSKLIEFPAGKLLSQPNIPYGSLLFGTANPDFAIVRPLGSIYKIWLTNSPFRAAAVQLSTGLVIISNTLALDVFSHSYVGEPNPGEVGLYEIGKGLQSKVVLHKN